MSGVKGGEDPVEAAADKTDASDPLISQHQPIQRMQSDCYTQMQVQGSAPAYLDLLKRSHSQNTVLVAAARDPDASHDTQTDSVNNCTSLSPAAEDATGSQQQNLGSGTQTATPSQ